MSSARNKFSVLALSFVFSTVLLVSGALALKQSLTTPEADVATGQSAKILWALFSDKTFNTSLEISAENEGTKYLSFPRSLQLPAGGAAYVEVTISIPHDYSGPSDFVPRMRARETVLYQGGIFFVDEEFKDIFVRVHFVKLENDTETTTTSTPTTQNATTGTDENQTTTQTTTRNQPTTTQQVSPTNVTQITNVTTTTVVPTPEETVEEEEREEARRELTRLNKFAERIEKLKERVRTEKISPSNFHNFTLRKGDLKKIEVGLRRNLTNVEIVVDTLAISREEIRVTSRGEIVTTQVLEETTPAGVVATSAEIVPIESVPAEERDVIIDIAGVRLPDIEKRVIREEVVEETPRGEVVRRITKHKAYKYLEINLENAQIADVEKTTIEFSVEKSWLRNNNVADPALVRLNRFVSDWVELPTQLVGEDATSYQYSAETEGFSFFVITAAITADITTPISIEIPQIEEQVSEEEDFVGDLLGTTRPQPILIVNISWILAVVAIGIVILIKYNDIKRAFSKIHAKEDRAKELENERNRYKKMKEETTKRFYKRIISEEEFKSLIKDYDNRLIQIETELAELKGKKK